MSKSDIFIRMLISSNGMILPRQPSPPLMLHSYHLLCKSKTLESVAKRNIPIYETKILQLHSGSLEPLVLVRLLDLQVQ